MQEVNSCGNCKNKFDNRKFQPKELDCKHVICVSCAQTLYRDNQQIKCPWDGQVTQEEPSYLPNYTIQQQQTIQIIQDCQIHQKPNVLYCSNDKSPICYSCVAQHAGHTIKSYIKEGIESLKANQIASTQETLLLIK